VYDDLAQHYKQRLAGVSEASHEQDRTDAERHFRYLELSRSCLRLNASPLYACGTKAGLRTKHCARWRTSLI
jgi:hypothetical protein